MSAIQLTLSPSSAPCRLTARHAAMLVVLVGGCAQGPIEASSPDALPAASTDSASVPKEDTAGVGVVRLGPADSGSADSGDVTIRATERDPGPLWPPPLELSSEGRIVAFGDVHGDIGATRRALVIGGLIDAEDHWIGGHTIALQLGDQIDRADRERAILDLFEALTEEAYAAGGRFIPLIGNHEQMNAQLDFRYVTEGGFAEFASFADAGVTDPRVLALPEEQRGRAVAFLPGGFYAHVLARHNVVQIVDTTLFVHGGIVPSHVGAGLAAINAEHQAWLRGEGELSDLWDGESSPVWDRTYSEDMTGVTCPLLEETLDLLGLERMVVAHTVQLDGISTLCGGRVVRIDVGLSGYYGGDARVLQILGGVAATLQ